MRPELDRAQARPSTTRRPLAYRVLPVVVFAAGASSLAIEICATRLLAPYFGNSTVVWANVIGLILVYLSVGYWLGGRIADRRPQRALLGRILVVSALAIVVVPFAARPFLDATVKDLNAASSGAVVGSFVAGLILFAIPVTLLGTVSPFAVRLALPDVAHAGSVAGRLYALSTIGSIVGTFLSALVAIPVIGTQRTLVGTATLVLLAGASLLGLRWQLLTLAAAALLLVPPGAVKAAPGLLWEGESPYQYIDVRQQDDGSRLLELNEGVVANSIWYPHSVL